MRRSAERFALLAVAATVSAHPMVVRAQAASVTLQNVVRVTIPERATRPTVYTAPAARVFGHTEQISTLYDDQRNVTTVSLAPMRIAPGIGFGAAFFVAGAPDGAGAGARSTPPFFIRIALALDADAWRLVRDSSFVLAFGDGSQVSLGRLAANAPPEADRDGGLVMIDLSIQTFLRMVNARSVVGRVAGETFPFSDEQMEALRDLAHRTTGPEARLALDARASAAVAGN